MVVSATETRKSHRTVHVYDTRANSLPCYETHSNATIMKNTWVNTSFSYASKAQKMWQINGLILVLKVV